MAVIEMEKRISIRQFLMSKGFRAETLAILTRTNLKILANEYGYYLRK